MPRRKGTLNTPQVIINKIVRRHHEGETLNSLTAEYKKPFKTIRNMCTRENNKLRNFNVSKQRGRKPAKTLQRYKYEIKRLKMENKLLRMDFKNISSLQSIVVRIDEKPSSTLLYVPTCLSPTFIRGSLCSNSIIFYLIFL